MASPAAIERRLARLRETYGDFPVETATTGLAPEAFARTQELHDRGVPGAARVWVEDGDTTLLVREATRPDAWGVPGGLIDPDEPATRAAEREVREETGLECAVRDVLYAHRATRRHGDGDLEPIEELAVAFRAIPVGGNLRPQPGEIREVEWWTDPPETLAPPADRIGAAQFDW